MSNTTRRVIGLSLTALAAGLTAVSGQLPDGVGPALVAAVGLALHFFNASAPEAK